MKHLLTLDAEAKYRSLAGFDEGVEEPVTLKQSAKSSPVLYSGPRKRI